MPPREPPRRPTRDAKIYEFKQKERNKRPGEAGAKITNLALLKVEIDRTRTHLQQLHSAFLERPPINVVIEIHNLIEELSNPTKKMLRAELISLVTTALAYKDRYPVKTYFELLEEHLQRLRKM